MIKQNKLAPKKRFKGFKNEWESHKFDDLAEIIRGASPRPIQNPKWFDKNSNVGWLRISDVTKQNGNIKYLEQRLSKLGEEKTRVLYEPHLLLSIAATVGKPVINYVKIGVHDGFLIFRKPKFDLQYMYQWLEMFRSNWNKYGQPGSQVNLNSEIVKKQVVMLPNLKEQKKIGQFFKHLDEMIALQQQKIDKVKALKSAYLAEMFPEEGESVPKIRFDGFTSEWKVKKLADIVTEISDGDWIETDHIFNQGKYRIIQTGNLGIGRYINRIKNAKYFHQENFDKLKANEIFPGDILVSRLAEPAGRTIILPETGFRMVTSVDVTVIRPNKEFDSIFLMTLMNSERTLKKINKEVTGTTHKRISRKNLERNELIVPKVFEQQKIGQFFKHLDDTILVGQKKLDKLKAMKQAYLHEMFV